VGGFGGGGGVGLGLGGVGGFLFCVWGVVGLVVAGGWGCVLGVNGGGGWGGGGFCGGGGWFLVFFWVGHTSGGVFGWGFGKPDDRGGRKPPPCSRRCLRADPQP